MPIYDILPAGGVTGGAGILPWLGTKHETFQWGAEFISLWKSSSTGLMLGTNDTAFLHDFSLTYLLPSPVQMERREIDF